MMIIKIRYIKNENYSLFNLYTSKQKLWIINQINIILHNNDWDGDQTFHLYINV